MAEEFIQSRQNPRVKALAKLQERSGRRKLGLFTVEGLREISRCADLCGLDEIYFCPEFFKSQEHFKFIESAREEGKIPLCRLSEGAFEKVSNREGYDGLIGVAKQWGCSLRDICLPENKNNVILVADAIEKPGNLGALMRSADSCGAAALILTNPVSDIFNPAVVRASQGALFSIQIAVSSPAELGNWLNERKIAIVGAHLKAKKFLWEANFKRQTAIVVGSEKDGLGDDWNNLLDETVKIPMNGVSDSMNVNVAAALFLYEAMRQQNT